MAGAVSVRRRFSLAYLALAALVGVAVGMLVVLVERPRRSRRLPGPRGSRPRAIARPAAADCGPRRFEYRLGGGKKLVKVLVRDPSASPNPIRDVAIARTLQPTQRSDVLAVVDRPNGDVHPLRRRPPVLDQSREAVRGATDVLRREALELALYSFRYLDNTDSVIAFFPPQDSERMYIHESGPQDALKTPLNSRCRSRRHRAGRARADERQPIDELTVPRQFRSSLRQERDGGNVLVLAPGS